MMRQLQLLVNSVPNLTLFMRQCHMPYAAADVLPQHAAWYHLDLASPAVADEAVLCQRVPTALFEHLSQTLNTSLPAHLSKPL